MNPEHIDTRQFTAIVFDIGGVVIEIDFDRAFEAWAHTSGEDSSVIKERFQSDLSFARFERGEIGAEQFLVSLRQTLVIDMTEEEFLTGWRDIFVGPMPGLDVLLNRLAGALPLFALTNTNPIHWKLCNERYWETMSVFDEIFVSFMIGCRKPDSTAFEFVLESISRSPKEVLFLDDSLANVNAAKRLGITAFAISSEEAITHLLADFDI